MTDTPDTTDPELAVHADDCRQQDGTVPTDAEVLELARLGLAFHFQTTMMHFLMACGRETDPTFKGVQAERVALATRITEIKDSLTDAQREFLHMERLTPAPGKGEN